MHMLMRIDCDLGFKILRACDSTTLDAETNANLGRAFLFPWKRKIIGIVLDAPVRPDRRIAAPHLTEPE